VVVLIVGEKPRYTQVPRHAKGSQESLVEPLQSVLRPGMRIADAGLRPRDGPFDCAQDKLRLSLAALGFAFAGQPGRRFLRQLSRGWLEDFTTAVIRSERLAR
jgi:hypothetical protein